MTCIAAIIDQDGVGHIASDSLGSNGHTKDVYKNQKIFQLGNMLIGYTSSYRMGQLLQYELSLPPRKVGQSLDKYMYTDFIASVRSLMKDHGYLRVDANVERIGSFLIVTEGRIYQMQDDLSLLETEDRFGSCGSGEFHAIATMHTLSKRKIRMSAEEILREAIETASKYVATVGGDVRILTASTTEDVDATS